MNIQTWIEKDPFSYVTRIWVREKDRHVKRNIYFNKDAQLEMEVIPEGCLTSKEKLHPFLEMNSDSFNEIMTALVTELSRNGIVPEKESVTAGKLQGMTDHKNDLKEILKSVIEKIPSNK